MVYSSRTFIFKKRKILEHKNSDPLSQVSQDRYNQTNGPSHEPILPNKKEEKTSGLSFVYELIKIAVIAIAIIIPVRYFLIQPFFVRGDSMYPTLHNGDYLIVNEISYELSAPVRGDIIIFRFPEDPSQFYVKRIIGLPGETVNVQDNQVTIKNAQHPEGFILDETYLPVGTITPGTKTETLKSDEYFVMGDNRTRSSDSRVFGAVPKQYIIGKTWVRAYPFNAFEVFSTPKINDN